ncbi:MAG: sugar transferase [Chloroflexi bacterium]|nr:sugar transferase [Chloroflexota bacterium]
MSTDATKKNLRWRLTAREHKFILLFGDLIASIVALLLAVYFWAQPDWLKFSLEFIQERIPFWFYLLPFLWLLLLIEIYDLRRAANFKDVIKGVFAASAVCLVLYLLAYFTSEPNSLPRRGVAVFIVFSFVLTLLWRYLYIKVFTAQPFLKRVLVIGAGKSGRTLARIVKEINPAPFHLVGFIDDDEGKKGECIEGYPVLGCSDDLSRLAEELQITDMIFSISKNINPKTFQNIIRLQEEGIEIKSMPAVYEELIGRIPITVLQSDWLLRTFVDQAQTGGMYNLAKRLIDIMGGLVGSVITLILYPFVALAILIDSGRPVIYSQKRIGKNGKEFKIYKFRTMINDAEKDGKAQMSEENDNRITRTGKFLRKSHIDEFPQFIIILKGDMSLVGPRAEREQIINELQEVVPFYRTRLLVKPGATGWAQVNYGYASTVEATTIKLEYDLYYIKHQSLFLDFSILIRTIGAVLGFRGR